MAGVPVADAARELGVSVGTLRRMVAAGAPVVQPGRRGRGCALLVDVQDVRAWRSATGGEAVLLDVAAAVPELLAGAMDEAFRLVQGPHKRATAEAMAGAWYLAAAAVLDHLRASCADVPELTALPERIQRLQKIARK